MKLLNFKLDHVTINIETITGISMDVDTEPVTVDIWTKGNEMSSEPYEITKYKYNEVVNAISNLLASTNTYREM